MKEIKLGISPLTNQIYAGHLEKNGLYWKEKQDVTLMALYCVAQHCIEGNEPVILLEHNKPKYEITVRVIND
ncbi:DUF7446 family protein [Glaesserella parasuis]|uniref:DUF7446 family protein n=1 Tax=Glaesserella parasuis TaxID=738 RepID=UPI0007A0C812|nr:hypothetical protein [Glaesserella parasuis]AMW17171.1 hypothetical protein A4U84_08170 [Glaesserella parasuis]MCT8526109.1 hypothetical protein [Glaesserella parasuis]MCT8528365.1 hypothetical protein [Glaesserella parasuis]MCT8530237.1 hypothetical protein [Glaesserella parasuis]MCT8531773.1 hypothetical protein [Glaesserella parasuis]